MNIFFAAFDFHAKRSEKEWKRITIKLKTNWKCDFSLDNYKDPNCNDNNQTAKKFKIEVNKQGGTISTLMDTSFAGKPVNFIRLIKCSKKKIQTRVKWVPNQLQGGTIKLSPKKRRHDSISIQWKPVFFFCCRPSTSWPVVYKSQKRYEPSIMSQSDTMFNQRDRRCTVVQLMLSTDPSYNNRTIASTLKMQIRAVQRVQGDENKLSGYGYGLWCGFKWGPHHATSHLRSWLESQHRSVPGCAEEYGDPLVQSGGRW